MQIDNALYMLLSQPRRFSCAEKYIRVNYSSRAKGA